MKINISPEKLVESLKSTYGGSVSGPTDLTETQDDVFFNIEYFGQSLKVIFNKTYGQINSSPFNRDFISKACAINESNKKTEESSSSIESSSTESSTSTTSNSTSTKPSLLFVTPEQLVAPLIKTYGTANISGPTDITENDGSVIFNMVYYGEALRVVCCKVFGTINSSPYNKEFVAHACTIHNQYKPKVDPNAPKVSKIYTTPEEVIKSFTSTHGEGSVTGPTDLNETEDNIIFNVVYFQQPLKVYFDKINGTINSNPFNREFVSSACFIVSYLFIFDF